MLMRNIAFDFSTITNVTVFVSTKTKPAMVEIKKALYTDFAKQNRIICFYLTLFSLLGLTSTQKIEAQGISSGVTFNWSDTQASVSDPATISSIEINGLDYNTFVVPSTYELTRLGPGGHSENNIWMNGSLFMAGSDSANWNAEAIKAYQSINLNHYFQSQNNGDNFCENMGAVATTDAQIQTIQYNPGIPSNPDGILAVTERGGNNCLYVELYGIPATGGAEQLLGSTFIRNQGNLNGVGAQAPPLSNSDYWRSGRNNENGQVIGIALFELSNLAPVGSTITSIQYLGATNDHGDGKFFLMQTYAVDDTFESGFDEVFNGDVGANDNVPVNSLYSTISMPSDGSLIFNPDGSFAYTPNPSFIGTDTFSVQVCLPAPNQAVCNTSTVSITVNPSPSELNIDDASAQEGDDLIFTITNSAPVSQPIVIDLSYSNTTTTDSDYNGSASVILPANASSISFNVASVDDAIIEPTETFEVVISTTNPVATITDDTGIGTITDNNLNAGDGIAFANNLIVTEGIDDFAVFNVTLTGVISENVTVDYTTNEGSALNPGDFMTTAGMLTFTPTESSLDIQVPITDDSVIEMQEAFSVTLSNIQSNLSIGFADGNTTNTANGIINDDDMVEIMVNPYEETITMICGDEVPEVPTLVFTGGCGNYTVDFTEVEDFSTGTDDFLIVRTWNVTDSCGNTASFQQIIFVLQRERSMIEIDICTEDLVIDLIDSLPNGFDTNGTFTVMQGDVTLEGSLFDPNGLELGEYLISYESTVSSCNYFADFVINVNADCLPCDINDLIVSKTITINGDGINDFFEITGLEDCGYTYSVQIFNRWGTMIYESQEYRNNWEGNAPGGSFGMHSTVPTGTYYYIIAVSDTEIQPINGYIYIGAN